MKGHYFAIASIATSLVLKDLFVVWNFVGAARGLEIPVTRFKSPDFLHLIFLNDAYYYYVIFGFFIVGFLFINSFRKSRLGARAGMVGLDLIIYAAVIMLISAFEPRGLWGIVARMRRRARS
ncbi:MAG: hypothetical protein WAW37_03355 [Syntrophobacteraceae bacterium]